MSKNDSLDKINSYCNYTNYIVKCDFNNYKKELMFNNHSREEIFAQLKTCINESLINFESRKYILSIYEFEGKCVINVLLSISCA